MEKQMEIEDFVEVSGHNDDLNARVQEADNMVELRVRISMAGDNDLNCSYAVVCKDLVHIIIILKDQGCAIFGHGSLREEKFAYH